MGKKLTTEQFIERAIGVHGDKFGYDRVIYVTTDTKVQIYCKTCNKYFHQTPNAHLSGQGCKQCGINSRIEQRTKTTEQFIKEAIKIHGDKYGYDKVVYIHDKKRIKIYCKIHNEYFLQKPFNHLQNQGCRQCGIDKNTLKNTKTTKQFIKEAIKIHGDKYGYDKVVYVNSQKNVEIYCKKHKKHFLQLPSSHLQKHGCPICNESKGEGEIRKYLEKHNIKYISQKWFSDCRNKKPLSFDFYLPDYNVCIEFQGRQHYELVNFNSKMSDETMKNNYNRNKKHDKIKKDYCLKNNIQLIEIPYWDFKKIEEYIVNINTSKEVIK